MLWGSLCGRWGGPQSASWPLLTPGLCKGHFYSCAPANWAKLVCPALPTHPRAPPSSFRVRGSSGSPPGDPGRVRLVRRRLACLLRPSPRRKAEPALLGRARWLPPHRGHWRLSLPGSAGPQIRRLRVRVRLARSAGLGVWRAPQGSGRPLDAACFFAPARDCGGSSCRGRCALAGWMAAGAGPGEPPSCAAAAPPAGRRGEAGAATCRRREDPGGK